MLVRQGVKVLPTYPVAEFALTARGRNELPPQWHEALRKPVGVRRRFVEAREVGHSSSLLMSFRSENLSTPHVPAA